MSETINFEEWLAELEKLEAEKGTNVADALTVREMVKKFGRCRQWICARLGEAIEAGKIRCVQRRTMNISGRSSTVPAYQLVKKDSLPDPPKSNKRK